MSCSRILPDCAENSKIHYLKQINPAEVSLKPYLIKVPLKQGHCLTENHCLHFFYQYVCPVFYLLPKYIVLLLSVSVCLFHMCMCICIHIYMYKFNLLVFSRFTFEYLKCFFLMCVTME